jgi:hypothetical protein
MITCSGCDHAVQVHTVRVNGTAEKKESDTFQCDHPAARHGKDRYLLTGYFTGKGTPADCPLRANPAENR